MTKEKNAIQEANRYLANAKEILRTKAGKSGKFYSDEKYVRMACNTAYSGLLIALNEFFKAKKIEFPKPKGKRTQSVNVDFYKDNLSKYNKSVLREFNSAYNYLHLFGGYDGDLAVDTSKNGLQFAENIINWIEKQL